MLITRIGTMRSAGAAVLAAGALLAVGCGASDRYNVRALESREQGQVLVACEAHQRTLVRQTVVAGEKVAQIDCVTTAGTVAAMPAYSPVNEMADTQIVAPPVAYRTAPVAYRTVPVAQRQVVTERRVVYERPARRTRSIKKSAIIIGSSAGAGAGIGALVGGKKGALIGAAIGGGGAAVWDQATRRR